MEVKEYPITLLYSLWSYSRINIPVLEYEARHKKTLPIFRFKIISSLNIAYIK